MEGRIYLSETTHYEIRCLRCGVLMAWSYTPGDSGGMPEANLVKLHEKFAKHSDPWRLHLLRFRKKEV